MIPEDASTKHAVEMCRQKDGKFDFVFQKRKVAENPTDSTVTGLKYPKIGLISNILVYTKGSCTGVARMHTWLY